VVSRSHCCKTPPLLSEAFSTRHAMPQSKSKRFSRPFQVQFELRGLRALATSPEFVLAAEGRCVVRRGSAPRGGTPARAARMGTGVALRHSTAEGRRPLRSIRWRRGENHCSDQEEGR